MKNKVTSLLTLSFILLGVSALFMFAVPGLPNTSLVLGFRFNKFLSLFLIGGLTGIGSYITQLLTRNKKADVSTLGVGAFNILGIIFVVFVLAAETIIIGRDNILIGIIFATSFIATITLWLFTKILFKNVNNLLITGLVLTLFASALAYILIDRLKVHEQQVISSYLVGSILINDSQFNIQQMIGIGVLVISALWLFLFGDKFLISATNKDKAKSLGLRVNVHIFVGLICIAITSASSFLIGGNMMFIGFAIGNMNYMIFKKNVKLSSIGIILIGGILSIASYYIFNRLFGYKAYEGIYIMVTSGVVLVITVIIERIMLWRRK